MAFMFQAGVLYTEQGITIVPTYTGDTTIPFTTLITILMEYRLTTIRIVAPMSVVLPFTALMADTDGVRLTIPIRERMRVELLLGDRMAVLQ